MKKKKRYDKKAKYLERNVTSQTRTGHTANKEGLVHLAHPCVYED